MKCYIFAALHIAIEHAYNFITHLWCYKRMYSATHVCTSCITKLLAPLTQRLSLNGHWNILNWFISFSAKYHAWEINLHTDESNNIFVVRLAQYLWRYNTWLLFFSWICVCYWNSLHNRTITDLLPVQGSELIQVLIVRALSCPAKLNRALMTKIHGWRNRVAIVYTAEIFPSIDEMKVNKPAWNGVT